MKITIAGTGYVGLSNAVLLAQNHEVIALDIIEEKVNMINNKISPIGDEEISNYLKTKELNLSSDLADRLPKQPVQGFILESVQAQQTRTHHNCVLYRADQSPQSRLGFRKSAMGDAMSLPDNSPLVYHLT